MLKGCHSTTPKELLGLISKKRNLLLAPGNVNFHNKSNDIAGLVSSLNTFTSKHNFINFKDIVGSSANAVIALLLGLGYTTKEISYKLNDITFYQSLNNAENKYYQPLSIVVDVETSTKTEHLKKQFKLSAQDSFLIWAQEQIRNKLINPMATFGDLNAQAKKQRGFKDIHLIALNIATEKLEIFNYQNTPDMPLAIAVRICMSFSTAFSIVEIKDLVLGENNSYLDGGIVLQHLNIKKHKMMC